MNNKYLYTLLKDMRLLALAVVGLIGVSACAALIYVNQSQNQALNKIRTKQALIAQIPILREKIIQIQGAASDLVLSGIISDKDQAMAVINDTLVKVGDEIEGGRVVVITAQSVSVCYTAVLNKCVDLLL